MPWCKSKASYQLFRFPQELHAAMRRAGQNPTESEVQDMINSVRFSTFNLSYEPWWTDSWYSPFSIGIMFRNVYTYVPLKKKQNRYKIFSKLQPYVKHYLKQILENWNIFWWKSFMLKFLHFVSTFRLMLTGPGLWSSPSSATSCTRRSATRTPRTSWRRPSGSSVKIMRVRIWYSVYNVDTVQTNILVIVITVPICVFAILSCKCPTALEDLWTIYDGITPEKHLRFGHWGSRLHTAIIQHFYPLTKLSFFPLGFIIILGLAIYVFIGNAQFPPLLCSFPGHSINKLWNSLFE